MDTSINLMTRLACELHIFSSLPCQVSILSVYVCPGNLTCIIISKVQEAAAHMIQSYF
jgi:hypothetical protein